MKFSIGDIVRLNKEMCTSFSWNKFGNLPGVVINEQRYEICGFHYDYLVRFDLDNGRSESMMFDEESLLMYEYDGDEKDEDIQTCDINDLFDIK